MSRFFTVHEIGAAREVVPTMLQSKLTTTTGNQRNGLTVRTLLQIVSAQSNGIITVIEPLFMTAHISQQLRTISCPADFSALSLQGKTYTIFALGWNDAEDYDGNPLSGEFHQPPKANPDHTYKSTLELGVVEEFSPDDFEELLNRLKSQWIGEDYDVRILELFHEIPCGMRSLRAQVPHP